MKQGTRHGPHTFSGGAPASLNPTHAPALSPRRPPCAPAPPRPLAARLPPPRARPRLARSAAGRRAGARFSSTPSLLCSFMIGTRPPETQPERREGSGACGRRGGRARLPHRTRRRLELAARERRPGVQRQTGFVVLHPRRGERPGSGPEVREEPLAL